ncbi:hypothetical protein [Zhongshania sp. BJYM1]|uniref:hypothetical protein n=1 Tax=Zhongshania aquatica TaxID=2965069 RepID=UPI0022B5E319|nr:hypothetical protein [Marortus sp. BJYM1]
MNKQSNELLSQQTRLKIINQRPDPINSHSKVPFTVYAEVETDPLKDEKGKFVERQYLGELGDERNPVWMVF